MNTKFSIKLNINFTTKKIEVSFPIINNQKEIKELEEIRQEYAIEFYECSVHRISVKQNIQKRSEKTLYSNIMYNILTDDIIRLNHSIESTKDKISQLM